MARRTAPSKLKTYAAKRDFSSTPEPGPRSKRSATSGRNAKPMFCVQKHLATGLHYDFRLEHKGVLLSWAIPKGPSLNPKDRRMAMRTEDHPIAYGDFEGVIPEGYGAGVVMLWDKGTWKLETSAALPDMDAMLDKGEIKFALRGEKLKGSWVLVRIRGFGSNRDREQWLLIKHRDKWAGEIDITEEATKSVKSFTDFPHIIASSGHLDALAHAPRRGGKAGQLLHEVVTAASALRPGEMPAPVRKPKAAPRKTPTTSPKSALSPAGDKPKLSNLTKVMYPRTGFTKGDVIEYYTRVAPLILPQLYGRAATLKRYPDGVEDKFFFEKRCPSHRPEWVKTANIALGSRDESIDFCRIDDLRTLVWVANLAAIELHVPLARAEKPDEPTMMVFDLDPGVPAGIADCAAVACRLRDLLKDLGLQCVAKTSGNKGIHVIVPLNTPGITFDQTKPFAHAVAQMLQKADPKGVTVKMDKTRRKGKVFIDWSQNDRAKTTAAVFTLRATPTPNLSWPVEWRHLEKARVNIVRADKPLPTGAYVKQFIQFLQLPQSLPGAPVAAPARLKRGPVTKRKKAR